jgi:hypothetical protein
MVPKVHLNIIYFCAILKLNIMKNNLICVLLKFTGGNETTAFFESIDFTQGKYVYSRNITNDLPLNEKARGIQEIVYGFNGNYIIDYENIDKTKGRLRSLFDVWFNIAYENDISAKLWELETLFLPYMGN